MLSSYTAIEVSPSDEHWIDSFWRLRDFATPLDGWYAFSLFDFQGKSFLQIFADGLSSSRDLSRSIRNFAYWGDRQVIDWYSGVGVEKNEKELLRIFENTHFTLNRPHDKYQEHYTIYRGIGKEDALNLFSQQEVEAFKLEGRKVDYYDRNKVLFQLLVEEKFDPREEFPKGISCKLDGELKNLAKRFLELEYTTDVVTDVFGLQKSKKSAKKLWFVRTRFFGAFLLEENDSVQIAGYDFGDDRRLSMPLDEKLINEFECTRWGLELRWGDKTPIEVEDSFRRFEKIRDTFYAIRKSNYEESERIGAVHEKLYIGNSSRREFRECPNVTKENITSVFRTTLPQVEDADFYVLSIQTVFQGLDSHTHILSFRQGFSCIWVRRFQRVDDQLLFINVESEETSLLKEPIESDLRKLFEKNEEQSEQTPSKNSL